MKISEQIESYLRKEYESGKTQEEMAAKIGITQPHIQRILSDPKKIYGITVKTLMKMFPEATLNFKGENVIAGNSGVNNGVLGVNNGTVNAAGAAESFRDRAIKELMDLDVPPECLLKVLKTIKNLEI